MQSNTIQAHCPSLDFAKIEEQVRAWDDVEAVGSLREKESKKDITTVFIKFRNEEAAQKSLSLFKQIPQLIIEQGKKAKAPAGSQGPVAGANKQEKSRKSKKTNLAAEFFKYEPSAGSTANANAESQGQRRGGRGGGRGRGNRNNANTNGQVDSAAPNAGIGGGRGGNGQKQSSRGQGHGVGRGGRGRGRGGVSGNSQNFQEGINANFVARGGYRQQQRPPYIPPASVNIAVVDNIPFNMTNLQIADAFCQFGQILDISRLEMMAMVFYDSQESVHNCIQGMNGQTLKSNVISVSSGSMKIPGPIAAHMGVI